MSLAVAGTEEVTVPAGKYTAWKVTTSDDDGNETLIWVDQKSRAVLKVSAKGPAFGGGTVSAELVEEKPAPVAENKAAETKPGESKPAGKKAPAKKK